MIETTKKCLQIFCMCKMIDMIIMFVWMVLSCLFHQIAKLFVAN